MTTHTPAHPHVLPMKVLISTFLALLVLTWATVAVRYIDLGEANLILALAIAVIKAALVALFFMHLRYEAPFNGLILCMALLFVALFVVIALLDTTQYQSNRLQYQQTPTASGGGN
ncbi:MAG: cytochrome C oxidase subunit IV family protein [Phycisphaerales bacterium]